MKSDNLPPSCPAKKCDNLSPCFIRDGYSGSSRFAESCRWGKKNDNLSPFVSNQGMWQLVSLRVPRRLGLFNYRHGEACSIMASHIFIFLYGLLCKVFSVGHKPQLTGAQLKCFRKRVQDSMAVKCHSGARKKIHGGIVRQCINITPASSGLVCPCLFNPRRPHVLHSQHTGQGRASVGLP